MLEFSALVQESNRKDTFNPLFAPQCVQTKDVYSSLRGQAATSLKDLCFLLFCARRTKWAATASILALFLGLYLGLKLFMRIQYVHQMHYISGLYPTAPLNSWVCKLNHALYSCIYSIKVKFFFSNSNFTHFLT